MGGGLNRLANTGTHIPFIRIRSQWVSYTLLANHLDISVSVPPVETYE